MSEAHVTIYVYLLNEGVDVWRPVQAIRHGDTYTIVSSNPDLEDEHWQFAQGEAVLCQPHTSSDGSQSLIAYAGAEPSLV